MKSALIIFGIGDSFSTSIEEITGEEFASEFSTDETRFSLNTVTVQDELFNSLAGKVGRHDFRVKLVASNSTPNGRIDGQPTTYVFINNGGELKVKSEF